MVTCCQSCCYSAGLDNRCGNKSGNMLPVLLLLPDDSKDLFEVLRLGPESPARQTGNFHHHIPSTWIDSGVGAPSPEWHPSGASRIARYYRRACTNDAPAAPILSRRFRDGVLLLTSSENRQQRAIRHRTTTGQSPDRYRTRTEQKPDKMQKV